VNRAVALACALGCVAACSKQYKVRIQLTQAAADQRLASGRSDVVDGMLKSGDGANIYVETDGHMETIARADVAKVDDYYARRDVRRGGVALVGGGVLAIGSLFFFEDCDGDKYGPLCAFSSKRNFWASVAFVGGVAIAGLGVQLLFSGMGGTSNTERVMKQASRWQAAPIIVGGEGSYGPGFGVAAGF
jgi:hypothetical protein